MGAKRAGSDEYHWTLKMWNKVKGECSWLSMNNPIIWGGREEGVGKVLAEGVVHNKSSSQAQLFTPGT